MKTKRAADEAARCFIWAGGSFRQNSKTATCWSDGVGLYSYRTCIATWAGQHILVINDTKYSRTTTRHQSALTQYLKVRDVLVLRVNSVPMGSKSNDVIRRAITSIREGEIMFDCNTSVAAILRELEKAL